MNKPNGQFVITPAEVPAFLQTLPLAKIPGVGKVSAAKLEAMGLRTCGDVQKCDLVMLLKRFLYDAVASGSKELYEEADACHYDIYEGAFFERVAAVQTQWFKKHL